MKSSDMCILVRIYWSESESESNIPSRWVQRESNLMFTLSYNKDKEIDLNSFSRLYSLSVNEPLVYIFLRHRANYRSVPMPNKTS